uniref:Uncharacterized protein n=1 Tax=Neobodo designis TaxID=312471 RepID=A0A7S1QIS6_NEODS
MAPNSSRGAAGGGAAAAEASATPIVDLVSLELARVDLEHERAQLTDRLREATVLRDRHAQTIETQTSRLKHHGAGMLMEDKAEIQREVLAATAAHAEAKAEAHRLTKDDRTMAAAIAEVRNATDSVYSALRREMLSAGTGADPNGNALREGIFSIVHELAELADASFFVYNPRAEGVPHFTTWETKTTSLIRSTTDKFTAAHRAILNALNKIASGSPDLASHDYLWATLVNDAANAFLCAVARVLDASFADIRRVLDGGCAQPLFSINVKLTANAKLVLAPAMTESYKLFQPLLTAAFDMAQLPHFRTAATVQAKAPASVDATSRPANAGRRGVSGGAKHSGPLSAAVASDCGMEQSLKYLPCLAGHVKGIQNACAVLDQRIADVIASIEASYSHLWSAQLPDMTLSQLEVSRRGIECDSTLEPGTIVGDAIHVNTFQLYDTILSMIAQQEAKLRAAALAKALEDVASCVEDSTLQSIRRGLPQSLLPPGASANGSGPPRKAAVLGAAPPAVPKMTIDESKLSPEAAHEAAKQQHQSQQQQKSQQQQQQPASGRGKEGTPRQQQSPSQSTELELPHVSPRPSTTPVGLRSSNRGGAGGASDRSQRGGAGAGRGADDSLLGGSASGTKARGNDGPSTPNPKADRAASSTRSGSAAAGNPSASSERLDFSAAAASSGSAAAAAPAWGTPPRPKRAAAEPDMPPSPASQARTNATLHMSTPPPSPSSAENHRAPSHMDRLAAKERESMDRLKQLRMQAEARRRALDEDAPDAPTPQQMEQQQSQHQRPASRGTTPRGTTPVTSGRRATPTTAQEPSTTTTLPQIRSQRQATTDSSSAPAAPLVPRSPTEPAVQPPRPLSDDKLTTDPDARRRERAAALQRERLQREREMLLESHRAQERRRDAERAQAEADLAAKIKLEQQRRLKELEAEKEADDRRREAAEHDRQRRESQRRADEQRESELRQRLDELERRRRNDARRFGDERSAVSGSTNANTSGSHPSSPGAPSRGIYATPTQATASPYSIRPSSRGGAGGSAHAIDPLSGTDTSGHAASGGGARGPPAGEVANTANASALRKKLGLPPSGTSTPTTASAPNTGRGGAAPASFGPPAGTSQHQHPPSTAPAASHQAPTRRGADAASPGPAKPSTADPAAGAHASTRGSVSASLGRGGSGSQPGQTADVAVDGVAAIDPTGKSHLEVYRAYCTTLNIKPNSGLLKSLPSEPGKHCSSINLDLNYIGVRGVRPLIEILKLNRGLTLLNLKDNNLENAEVRQIVSVLMGDAGRSITHLDLSNNPISLAGGSAIMDLVARQPTLRTVVLKGTLIQAKVVEKITDAAARNPGA